MKEFFKIILYKPLFNLLVFFSFIVPGHSVGWAIILLTIVVRLVLWVPNAKALQAPLKMRQYQDDIKRLQEQYKDNRTAQSQALMAFYKEKGINPLSGCLPILIQLPILIILYQVFMTGISNLRPDLIYSFTPHLDSINQMFFGLNLAEPDKTYILPIIAALLQFLQTRSYQKLNAGSTAANDPAAMMNKQMVYLFPIMTLFFAARFPAGLALYWATTTAMAWLQQIYTVKTFVHIEPKVAVTVRSKK